MKSLICSDIHDHINNLKTALQIAQTSNCDSIICCGDLCSPFIIDIFHKYNNLPVHIIFGNNDGDQFNIQNKCIINNKSRDNQSQIKIYGQFCIKNNEQNMAGIPDDVSLAVHHYPQTATSAFKSGEYNFAFYGHTHIPKLEIRDGKLLANPGSLMGYVPSGDGEFIKPSCLIVDWNKNNCDLIEL